MGTIGLVVGLFVFVILGIPSAGAAVPLQATPAWFEWLARFEPLHQVSIGTRSLLYLGGRADAGLSQSLEWSAAGLVIGVLFGVVVTRLYDRRGRLPAVPAAEAPAGPADTDAAVPFPEQ